jgi:hypothetical protein
MGIAASPKVTYAGNEGFNAYMDAGKRVIEIKLSKQIHDEEKKRFEIEQERLAKIDEKQRKVHRHCLHVREGLLTRKCPRQNCRQAFLDFDGCFALTCSSCCCGFCAWCLEDWQRRKHTPSRPKRQMLCGIRASSWLCKRELVSKLNVIRHPSACGTSP